jgi:hypothetical protein
LFVCSFVNKHELSMDFVNFCGCMLGHLALQVAVSYVPASK